jgi:transposase-like protein
MSDKTREAHVRALSSVLRHGRDAYDIQLWLCDYCPAQAGAITELYPAATIQHCVKHFDANVEKAVAKHGANIGLAR